MFTQTKNTLKLVRRDRKTLKIKECVDATNTLTLYGDFYAGEGDLGTDIQHMGVTPVKLAPDVVVLSWFRTSRWTRESTTNQSWTKVLVGDRVFWESSMRWNAPSLGTSRTINAVFLTSATSNFQDCPVLAYAPLSSTFVQQDTDVLDIIYRIEFVGSFSGSGYNVSKKIKENIGDLNMVSPAEDSFQITYSPARGNKNFSLTTLMSDLGLSEDLTDPKGLHVPPHYVYYETDFSKSDAVGKLLRSFTVRDRFDSDVHFMSGPLLNDDFPYKPVQVIHNHGPNADFPFLDVDNLASGSGDLVIDGQNWDLDNPYCDYWYINIGKTGDTGVGGYTLSVRRSIAGFQDEYRPGQGGRVPAFHSDNTGEIKYDPRLIIEYSTFPWVITYYSSGFSLVNIETSEYRTFSPTSLTTVINFSKIQQIAVLDDGSIWAADRNQGLYKISNPLVSPTVTKFTNTVHGIPSDNNCFAVCEGYNGSIWAAFTGGIARTDNGGSSWTIYNTSNGFVNTDFTAAPLYNPTLDHSKIQIIVCDIEHPDHHLAIMHDLDLSGTQPQGLMWWSPVALHDSSNLTPWTRNLGSITNERTTIEDPDGVKMVLPGLIGCSRKGGVWVVEGKDHNYTYPYWVTWGKPRLEYTVNVSEHTRWIYPQFRYDNYGSPHSLARARRISSNDSQAVEERYVTSPNGEYTEGEWYQSGAPTQTVSYFPLICFERADLGGSYQGSLFLDGQNEVALGWTPFKNSNFSDNATLDSFGVRHIITRDMTLEDWNWNPNTAQFERNYQRPATDISDIEIDGVRTNFDVESHTFTGRSSIDVSHVFDNGIIDEITFTAMIEPGAAEQFTGYDQSLLSFDGLDLMREKRSAHQVNAIYWNLLDRCHGALEGIDDDSSILRYMHSQQFDPIITIHTAGVLDTPAQPVRMVATLERQPGNPEPFPSGTSTQSDTFVWDPVTRSASYDTEITTQNDAVSFTWLLNESRELDDFKFRFVIGDDNHQDQNFQDNKELRVYLWYRNTTHGPNFLQSLRNTSDIAIGVSFRMDSVTPYGWTDSGAGGFNSDDRDGVNTLEVRLFTSDAGANWEGEINRIENPGVSEVVTTLYTLNSPTYHNPNAFYDGYSKQVPAVEFYDRWASNVGLQSGKQWYKNLEFIDNNDQTDLIESSLKTDIYVGKVYLDGILHSESTIKLWDCVPTRISSPTPLGDAMCESQHNPRKMIVGAGIWKHRYNFYRGEMRNLQIWNLIFDSTDVTSDYNQAVLDDENITTTQSAALNLIGHWPLVENLSGLETKLTHVASEEFLDGIEVAFSNGASSPAWNKGDFYTVGLTDGILKDNAMSFDLRKDLFFKPSNIAWNYIEASHINPGTLVTTVPPVNTTTFWETMTFVGHHVSGTNWAARAQAPGQLAAAGDGNSGYNTSTDIRSLEQMRGGGEYQFRVAADEMGDTQVLFTRVPAVLTDDKIGTTDLNEGFYIQFNEDQNSFDLVASGSTVVNDRSFAVSDLFRILRSGNVYTVYHNTNAIWTFDATSQSFVQGSEPLSMSVRWMNTTLQHYAFYDCRLKTYKARPEVHLGNSVSELGRYSPVFATFAWQEKFWEINLDGNPPLVTHIWTQADTDFKGIFTIPDPDPGEVVVLPFHGVILFNSADVGKNIQVNCVLLELK